MMRMIKMIWPWKMSAFMHVCTGVGVVEVIQLMALFWALHSPLMITLNYTVQYNTARLPRNHAQTPATKKKIPRFNKFSAVPVSYTSSNTLSRITMISHWRSNHCVIIDFAIIVTFAITIITGGRFLTHRTYCCLLRCILMSSYA